MTYIANYNHPVVLDKIDNYLELKLDVNCNTNDISLYKDDFFKTLVDFGLSYEHIPQSASYEKCKKFDVSHYCHVGYLDTTMLFINIIELNFYDLYCQL